MAQRLFFVRQTLRPLRLRQRLRLRLRLRRRGQKKAATLSDAAIGFRNCPELRLVASAVLDDTLLQEKSLLEKFPRKKFEFQMSLEEGFFLRIFTDDFARTT